MNAMVNIPIDELDKLRDEVKKLTTQNKNLLEREHQVRLEVVAREAHFINNPYGGWSNHFENKFVLQNVTYKNIEDILEPLKEKARGEVQNEIKH